MDFNHVVEVFEEYIKSYDRKVMEIDLKYHHSYKVASLMEQLASILKLTEEEVTLAKVIGLLHDIGRFEQFSTFSSFNDRKTKQDHADQSCVYLFEEGHIRAFLTETKYDAILEKAIRYHNKFALPEDLTKKERLFCEMIRDMDKVDIYYQNGTHFSRQFQKDAINPEVLAVFHRHQTIPVTLVKSKSDAVLVNLAFLFDINFKESYAILKETGNFDVFLSSVFVEENSKELWGELVKECYQVIEKGSF